MAPARNKIDIDIKIDLQKVRKRTKQMLNDLLAYERKAKRMIRPYPPTNLRDPIYDLNNTFTASYPTTWAASSKSLKWDNTTAPDHFLPKEKSFEPSRVDWKELMTLYQDDPLLMAIFDGLKEFYADGDEHADNPYFKIPPAATSGANPYLTGITDSTGNISSSSSISPSFTLKYDANGVGILETTTVDSSVNATVTWKQDVE